MQNQLAEDNLQHLALFAEYGKVAIGCGQWEGEGEGEGEGEDKVSECLIG